MDPGDGRFNEILVQGTHRSGIANICSTRSHRDVGRRQRVSTEDQPVRHELVANGLWSDPVALVPDQAAAAKAEAVAAKAPKPLSTQLVEMGLVVIQLALVIGSDTNSRVMNPKDRGTFPLFGDGAGAVLLGPGGDKQGMLAYTLGADGSGMELLWRPGGGSKIGPSTAVGSKTTVGGAGSQMTTGGAGSYTMALSHYDPVPASIQQGLAAEFQPAADEA